MRFESFQALRVALGFAAVVFAASCSDKGQPKGKPAAQTLPKIELSEPQAGLLMEKVGGENVLMYHWKAKYRFVEGQPQADATYTLNVHDPALGIFAEQIKGTDLKPEGVLERKRRVLQQPSKVLKISISGFGSSLSNELTCEVKQEIPATPQE